MFIQIVDRDIARKIGMKTYFKGIPCTQGHISERRTIDTKCLECKRGKDRRYYVENKSKIIEKVVCWRKENPENAKRNYKRWLFRDRPKTKMMARNSQHRARVKKAGTEVIFNPQITKWLLDQRKSCRYCGDLCEKNYEIDHFVPICKGGRHEIENLVISCPSCNRKKGKKEPIQFLREIRNAK